MEGQGTFFQTVTTTTATGNYFTTTTATAVCYETRSVGSFGSRRSSRRSAGSRRRRAAPNLSDPSLNPYLASMHVFHSFGEFPCNPPNMTANDDDDGAPYVHRSLIGSGKQRVKPKSLFSSGGAPYSKPRGSAHFGQQQHFTIDPTNAVSLSKSSVAEPIKNKKLVKKQLRKHDGEFRDGLFVGPLAHGIDGQCLGLSATDLGVTENEEDTTTILVDGDSGRAVIYNTDPATGAVQYEAFGPSQQRGRGVGTGYRPCRRNLSIIGDDDESSPSSLRAKAKKRWLRPLPAPALVPAMELLPSADVFDENALCRELEEQQFLV